MHHEIAAFGGGDQAAGSSRSCSTFGNFICSPRHRAGVSSSRPPGSRIIEGASPADSGLISCDQLLPSGMCRALNWRSFPLLRLPHFLSRLFRFPVPLTEFVQFGNLKKEIG